MPARVLLEVTSGPIQGKVFTFEEHDTLLFGRTADCQIGLPKDGCVSRHHFILEVNPPDARVRDLGSLNGTVVNDVKYGGRSADQTPQDVAGREFPYCDLKGGDRITVGNTSIAVTVEAPAICSACGTEIPDEKAGQGDGADENLVCANCQVVEETQPVIQSPPTPPCCDRCGKDVTSEIGGQRQGEYVCESCRGELVSDAGGIQKLLHAARHRDEGKPDVEGYIIDGELGKGGMGVVYRARSKRGGKVVAIKLMLAKVAVNERARKMSGGAFYCVMEFCNQGCLDGLLKRRGKLTLKTAGPLMIQCLAGLVYAHKNKFVHRDLKPQNILLHKHEGQVKAKLTDFGLAKSFETAGLSGMTATGTAGGTFHYMPREQLTNFKYVQPVSDVWSMAATFYQVLTGKYPLDFPRNRDPMEVILRDEAIPIRQRDASVPKPLADVIDRALLSDTMKRYQDASEMRIALQQALRKK